MFEKVFGLPAHPLVVHAAVVLIPITILTAIAYVLVPRLRPRLGWVLVLTSLGGGVASYVAAETGDRLAKHLGGTPEIDKHGGFGLDTRNMALLMAIVSVVLVIVDTLRARSADRARASYSSNEWTMVGAPTRSERRGTSSSGSTVLNVVSIVLMLALLASAVGAGVSVARAGDTGARMVWQNV